MNHSLQEWFAEQEFPLHGAPAHSGVCRMEPSDHPKVFQEPTLGAMDATSTQTPHPILPDQAPTPSHLKPAMSGFRKVCRTEEAGPSPFPGLTVALEMRVKEGSKIRNLMGFAVARMQGEEGPGSRGLPHVVFTGSGRAVTKTITCAEIMKRRVGGLHQLTKLRYCSVLEVWESGNVQTTVRRHVPSISILLSKDPLDVREPGYQPPEAVGILWGSLPHTEGPQQPPGKRPPNAHSHLCPVSTKRHCDGGDGAINANTDLLTY